MGLGLSLGLGVCDVTAYSPATEAGVFAYLLASSVVLDGSGNVHTWTDLTGNGNSPTQATAGLRPGWSATGLNGAAALLPNGTSQYLSTAGVLSATPATVFLVAKASTTSVRAAISNTVDGNSHSFYNNTSSTFGYLTGGSVISATATTTNANVFACVINGASSAVYVNGVKTTGTLGAEDTKALLVGAFQGPSDYWDGPIGAVLMSSSVLSAAAISRVGKFFTATFNITGSW